MKHPDSKKGETTGNAGCPASKNYTDSIKYVHMSTSCNKEPDPHHSMPYDQEGLREHKKKTKVVKHRHMYQIGRSLCKKENRLTTGANVSNPKHSWQRNTVTDTINEKNYKHSCLMYSTTHRTYEHCWLRDTRIHTENVPRIHRDCTEMCTWQELQGTNKRNFEARSCKQCWCGKAISTTYSERVFVVLGTQHATCMRRMM
jgi:hypothetical protein